MKRKKEENEFFPLHPYYLIIDSEQNLGFVSQSVEGGKNRLSRISQMKRPVMGGKQILLAGIAAKKYILKLNLPWVQVLVAKD